MNESGIAALCLALGSITIFVTIFMEYQVGWIDAERRLNEVPGFIRNHWSELRLIWGWQVSAHMLFAIAYLLLFKATRRLKSFFLAALFLSGLLVVVSFLAVLGGYYPALKVYEDQPAVFESMRGAIGNMYAVGRLGLVLLLPVFLLEVFGLDQRVDKRVGVTIFVFIAVAISMGLFADSDIRIAGATWFLMPLVLGYSLWRKPIISGS